MPPVSDRQREIVFDNAALVVAVAAPLHMLHWRPAPLGLPMSPMW